MKFFTMLMTAISIIPQLFSIIDQVVVNVEQGLGNIAGISGNQKLAAAEAKVNSFIKDAISDVNVAAGVIAVVKPMINAAVAAFNAAGIFTHKTPAVSAGAAPQNPTQA